MHIKDGFLAPEVCLATGLIAAGAVAYGLKKLNKQFEDRVVPMTGAVSALIFAGQMVNFPLPGLPVSGHLMGGVLAATTLGPWIGCVAISVVLFVQVALFYDGGWTVLGANILNMGVVGATGSYLIYELLRGVLGNSRKATIFSAMLAAWFSVLAAAALFWLEFRLSYRMREFDFGSIFTWMMIYHSLIGVGEALITGFVLNYMTLRRPDLFSLPKTAPISPIWARGTVVVVAALLIAAFLAPWASEFDDGLDSVAAKAQFDSLEKKTTVLVLDDYRIPGFSESWEPLAVALAGISGTLVVLLAATALTWNSPLEGNEQYSRATVRDVS